MASVNKSARVPGAIVFFIGASIALETRSVKRGPGALTLQITPTDYDDISRTRCHIVCCDSRAIDSLFCTFSSSFLHLMGTQNASQKTILIPC